MGRFDPVQWETLGLPKPQGSVKAFVAKGRAHITSNHSNDFVVWRNALVERAERVWAGRDPLDVAKVGLVFTLPRPKSQPKYMSGFNLHWKTPDIDKLSRAVLDALVAAGVLSDDKVVWSLHASKYYQHEHGALPGVVITVTPSELPVSPRATKQKGVSP